MTSDFEDGWGELVQKFTTPTEPEYVVWCTHLEDKSATTFGPFPNRDFAEDFVSRYGFDEEIHELRVIPLNRITIVENYYGEEEEGQTPQTTH
tara:strand:+ start:329 stop:607 length:279 start_codon:yes stop_codon:yes gene_type:complete